MTRLRLGDNIVIKAARFGAKLNRTTNVAAIDRLPEQQRLRTIAASPWTKGSRPPPARELVNADEQSRTTGAVQSRERGEGGAWLARRPWPKRYEKQGNERDQLSRGGD